MLFEGDAGYDSEDPGAQGPQHRAILDDSRWRYIYANVDAGIPPMMGMEPA